MRPTYFGTYDFAASGVKTTQFQLAKSGRTGLTTIPGANGAFDTYGTAQNPLEPIRAQISLTLTNTGGTTVDAKLDTLLTAMQSGLQWLKCLLDDEATTRQTYAKCVEVSYPRESRHKNYLPVSLTFEIAEPFWYAASQTTDTFAVSATPTACDVTNSGTAEISKAILRFTGTCNQPKFTNNTNGFSILLARNITSSGIVEINLATQTVTFNAADDWANVTIPSTQIGLFLFDVGTNDIDFTANGGGTPSGTVQYIYRLTYH